MNYEEFADLFFSQVAKVQDNTLLIDDVKAQTLIRENREHAISFFNDHIEALEVLNVQGSEVVKSKKLLQLFDLLLLTIALYFETEDRDTSYKDRLTTTMKRIIREQ